MLDAYAAGGGNFIDTADSYSGFVPGNSGDEESPPAVDKLVRECRVGNILASTVTPDRSPQSYTPSQARVGPSSWRCGSSRPNLRAREF